MKGDDAIAYRCPRCRTTELVAAGGGVYSCGPCGVAYPAVDGIPWLYDDPARALGEWRGRLALYLDEFALAAREARRELADGGLRAATTARVATLAAGYEGQAQLISELLAPLALAASELRHATLTALGTRVPLSQDLHSYYANLHRDWCWGDEENARSHALVARALGAPVPRLLVLGAGAGRLAYDLHRSGAGARTVALDINPLLLIAARRLAAGASLELYEFPIAPRTPDDVALRRRLAAPEPARAGLDFVFADAWNAPFAAQSFDAVVTPWLVDIVELDLPGVAAHVNRLLRPGGRWVNFGSLAFPGRSAAARYGRDEVLAIAAEQGFEIRAAHDETVPYMQSPASRHGRIETVFTFAAEKARRAPRSADPPRPPDWLADTTRPVPREPFELRATATRIQALLLALVDGQRSLDDLVRIVTEQRLLGAEEARAVVEGYFARAHAEHERDARRVN